MVLAVRWLDGWMDGRITKETGLPREEEGLPVHDRRILREGEARAARRRSNGGEGGWTWAEGRAVWGGEGGGWEDVKT